MDKPRAVPKHIVLTSHPHSGQAATQAVRWGASSAKARGPVIGTLTNPGERNVIGAHAGSYALYRALAVAAGGLDPVHRPDLTNTSPTEPIGPFPQWADPDRIVSLDPYGHMVADVFGDLIESGCDIRPTIAVTRARISLPELKEAISAGRLMADGNVLLESGEASVIKAAVESTAWPS